MTDIDIRLLKKLRKETGSGVMNCRKALKKAAGDFDKARKILAEESAAIAAKKEDRETKAGLIEVYLHNNGQIGAMVKLTCETDFVARNKEFKKLAHELAMQVAAIAPISPEDLLAQDYIRDPEKKVKDLVKETIGKLKENIQVDKIARLEA